MRRALQCYESQFGLEEARKKFWRRFAYYTMRQAQSPSFPSDKDIFKFVQDSISLCDDDEQFIPVLIDVIKNALYFYKVVPKTLLLTIKKQK